MSLSDRFLDRSLITLFKHNTQKSQNIYAPVLFTPGIITSHLENQLFVIVNIISATYKRGVHVYILINYFCKVLD